MRIGHHRAVQGARASRPQLRTEKKATETAAVQGARASRPQLRTEKKAAETAAVQGARASRPPVRLDPSTFLRASSLTYGARGIVLLEVIVYVLLVVAIVGVMSSTVFIAAQTLRKRAERELKDEHWLTLVEGLRDDLRSARQVHWKPPPAKGQPEVLLAVQRPDGVKVEYLRQDQQMLRRVTPVGRKTVETPYPFQTTAWKLFIPKDGARDVWALQELPADAQFTIGPTSVFFYLTVTVHGQDRRMIFEQLGVTTRCEGAPEVKP